jgi:Ca2+-binding RTX toxin-like protein
MAKVTYTGLYQLRSYDFDLSKLDEGLWYEQSPTSFKAVTGSLGQYWIELQGTGFTFAASGLPTSGIVERFTSVDKSGRDLSLTDLNVSAAKLIAVASTPTLDDDLRIYKIILSGNDVIRGGKSGDIVEGFNGNDTLIGGGSSDELWGGRGADRFVFESVNDSRNPGRGMDFILDFSRAQGDKVDLSKIDAKTGVAGNQAFHFIGTAEFSKVKGQLRYEPTKFDISSGETIQWSNVQGDTNGDGKADLEISIDKVGSVTKGYFIL